MSRKTLNEKNLAALGAERLAALLIEVSTGSAPIKRRLRLELSHDLGPAELAHDLRKRLASIRRSKSYVGWRKRKALVKDLATQSQMIAEKIAPEAPSEAFELLWEFLGLAPGVYARVDDSRGEVGAVFGAALVQLADIAPNAGLASLPLAERVWTGLRDDDHGQFDDLISLLAPTLGDAGLDALKAHVNAYSEAASPEPTEHAALQFLRDLRGDGGNYAAAQKDRFIRDWLQQIARAQGDIDGYIAGYTHDQLCRPTIAAQVATILLDAGRAQEALSHLEGADVADARHPAWDHAYIACLAALSRPDDAQEHRWRCFCDTLDVDMLRAYLKPLPDFDDIEVEDAAKAQAAQHAHFATALTFFLRWPDLAGAAQLIRARTREIDGGLHSLLTPAADALRDKYPLAATALWRAMIERTLFDGRASRYAQAADQLMDCAAADADITDYEALAPHDDFLRALRARYERKASFWARVP
jgi:hypothetical protein